MSKPTVDLTGQVFGRLTVIRRELLYRTAAWICRCECGNETLVLANRLKRDITRSCGCLAADVARKGHTTHGLSDLPLYSLWAKMRRRCLDPTCPQYEYYGARGIGICERWATSFEAFVEDMGPRPSPDHSVDRIDNDGGYEPGNCRWATQKEQCRNRRTNRLITASGQTKMIIEWAESSGINRKTISHRLDLGWDHERAVTAPLRQHKGVAC